MNKTQRARLLKLADFLEKLPHKQFDFAKVMRVWGRGTTPGVGAGPPDIHKCGAVGCAIGWCPTLFPRLVKWGKRDATYFGQGFYEVSLAMRRTARGSWRRHGFREVARALFGLSWSWADMLFSPDSFSNNWRGFRPASDDATPKRVAFNLRRFVWLADRKKINPLSDSD